MPLNKINMQHTFQNVRPILKVENLSIIYDTKTIIKDVNLLEYDVTMDDHTSGQMIAVVGRSGRGKSTLFRSLTGLVRPTTGQILIPDDDSPDPDAARPVRMGEVGFVDQKYTLMRHKTVTQILEFALRQKPASSSEKIETINNYLNDWGLMAIKDSYPHEMSGGQRQRVAIIAQLLCSGHFMVLDEPFSGLDAINIEDAKKSFELISNQHELNTIIFSTHDIELACEIAQVIYVIGYPTLEDKTKANYGTIVQKYDLREMGLAAQECTPAHRDLAQQIILDMRNS
jgi:ABC-type nitrate/sulfonate/bicarbonate transport system ATPase subunit